MMDSVQKHLAISMASVPSQGSRLVALRSHDWTAFALAYDGRTRDDYDTQVAAAYNALSPAPLAAPAPRAVAR